VLFDAVYPTPDEQYLLELINRARANSQAEVQRLVAAGQWPTGAQQDVNEGLPAGTISTAPAQPLAMNPYLLDASRKHEQYLLANPNVTDPHAEIVNGVNIDYAARDQAAGYPVSDAGGENIWTAFGSPTNDIVTQDIAALEAGTFIDYGPNGGTDGRGHRVNTLNPAANEVGLGLITTTSNGFPEYQVTEDYGNAGQTSFLCGITYNDTNQDQFYEPGEELAGVTITATNGAGQTFTTTSWASGGYSLALAPGTYTVVASGGNIGTPAMQTVTIGNQNVEADFIAANTAPAAPVIVTQPVSLTTAAGATTFSFSVAASGSPVPTVQWQVAPFGSTNFTNITGATSYTYTAPITPDLNANQYQAVLTNSQGSVTSNVVTLTIPGGTVVPINVTLAPAGNTFANAGDSVTLTSAATGYSNIQWEYSNNGGVNPQPIAGATGLDYTLTATPDLNGNLFDEHLSNPTTAVDEYAFVNVNTAPTAPTITNQPQNQVAPGGNDPVLSVSVQAWPMPSIQWQVFSNGSFQNVSGGTATTLSVAAPARGKSVKYQAVISNGNGSVTTNVVTVTGNGKSALTDDLTNLRTASNAALAAIKGCQVATANTVAKLSKDLKRLKASASAKALLKTLSKNELVARIVFTRDEVKLLNRLNALAAKIRVEAHKAASNTTVAAQLQTDLSTLSTLATTSDIPADATACKLATTGQLQPISNIAPTDLQLQSDVVSAETNAYNVDQAQLAPITQAQLVVQEVRTDAT
jgi:hypothetical protein